MVQRNPTIEIKLIMDGAKKYTRQLLEDERIKSMIVAFKGVDEEFIASLPGGMIFESVTHFDISDDGRPFSDVNIEVMEQFLRRTPNVTWLRLRQFFFPELNVTFRHQIYFFAHESRTFGTQREFTSADLESLLEFLLTSRQLPKLKHLDIDRGLVSIPEIWIVSALEADIKPGFRQLTMSKRFSDAKFMVRKKTMTIKKH